MRIRFTKMQGAATTSWCSTRPPAPGLSAASTGTGRPPLRRRRRPGPVGAAVARPGIDFEYVIHNADGGEVEQCGNGARCFARYVARQGPASRRRMRVQTLSGVI
jgi:diaminopimelate epimerase